ASAPVPEEREKMEETKEEGLVVEQQVQTEIGPEQQQRSEIKQGNSVNISDNDDNSNNNNNKDTDLILTIQLEMKMQMAKKQKQRTNGASGQMNTMTEKDIAYLLTDIGKKKLHETLEHNYITIDQLLDDT
ncbi:nipped-B protein, partial [Reticulomyxa filosa]